MYNYDISEVILFTKIGIVFFTIASIITLTDIHKTICRINTKCTNIQLRKKAYFRCFLMDISVYLFDILLLIFIKEYEEKPNVIFLIICVIQLISFIVYMIMWYKPLKEIRSKFPTGE